MCLFVVPLVLPVVATPSSLSDVLRLVGSTCEHVSHPLILIPSRFDGTISMLLLLHTHRGEFEFAMHTTFNMRHVAHVVRILT